MKTIPILIGCCLIASCSQYGENAYVRRMNEIKEARLQGELTAVEMVEQMEDAEARRVYRRPKSNQDPTEETYSNQIAAIKESRQRGDISAVEMETLMQQAEAQRDQAQLHGVLAVSAATAGWGALGGFTSIARLFLLL